MNKKMKSAHIGFIVIITLPILFFSFQNCSKNKMRSMASEGQTLFPSNSLIIPASKKTPQMMAALKKTEGKIVFNDEHMGLVVTGVDRDSVESDSQLRQAKNYSVIFSKPEGFKGVPPSLPLEDLQRPFAQHSSGTESTSRLSNASKLSSANQQSNNSKQKLARAAVSKIETGADFTVASFAAPAQVDLSASLYFPQVGDQKQVPSCGYWALYYYNLTYSIARLRASPVRSNGVNVQSRVCNPIYRYLTDNYTEKGDDLGCAPYSVYPHDPYSFDAQLMQNGKSTMSGVKPDPYLTYEDYQMGQRASEENIFKMPLLNEQTEQAISYFSSEPGELNDEEKQFLLVNSVGKFTEQSIQFMKKKLSQNELLFVTFEIPSNFDAIVSGRYNDPDQGLSNGVLYGMPSAFSTRGGHGLNIVGYDDERIYYENGQRKKGAFLFVNSWGKDWGFFNTVNENAFLDHYQISKNSDGTMKNFDPLKYDLVPERGYVWISYDLLKKNAARSSGGSTPIYTGDGFSSLSVQFLKRKTFEGPMKSYYTVNRKFNFKAPQTQQVRKSLTYELFAGRINEEKIKIRPVNATFTSYQLAQEAFSNYSTFSSANSVSLKKIHLQKDSSIANLILSAELPLSEVKNIVGIKGDSNSPSASQRALTALFNPSKYAQCYSEVRQSISAGQAEDELDHFIRFGLQRNYDPNGNCDLSLTQNYSNSPGLTMKMIVKTNGVDKVFPLDSDLNNISLSRQSSVAFIYPQPTDTNGYYRLSTPYCRIKSATNLATEIPCPSYEESRLKSGALANPQQWFPASQIPQGLYLFEYSYICISGPCGAEGIRGKINYEFYD